MPPKMSTLPAASLDDEERRTRGGFAIGAAQARVSRRLSCDGVTSPTPHQGQQQGLWAQREGARVEPRAWSFPASHKPSGEGT